MASDTVVVVGHQTKQPTKAEAAANPGEPDNLACPRCESTNTKFCYYNNYNLSQPRYFCKGCRRYWTRGGTLRNVPVGGGSRKKPSSSSSKRSRPNTTSSSLSSPLPPPRLSSLLPNTTSFSEGGNTNEAAMNVDEPSSSFMSLLTATDHYGQGLGLGLGYGLELGFGHAGFDEIGLGFGFGSSGENQLGGSDGSGTGDINLMMDGGDCFAWPDLTISTPLD